MRITPLLKLVRMVLYVFGDSVLANFVFYKLCKLNIHICVGVYVLAAGHPSGLFLTWCKMLFLFFETLVFRNRHLGEEYFKRENDDAGL